MQTTKRLIVAIPGAEYRRLAELAAAEEREPSQQATYFVRRALAGQINTEEVNVT